MRAAVCTEPGPARNLTLGQLPDPVPRSGQVLVEVRAAGVNYVDALFVEGRYQIKPPVPFVPGSEIAGTVTAVGPDTVVAPALGTRVMASVGLGGFAEQVTVPVTSVVPLPDGLADTVAATLAQSYATMRFALTNRTTVRPDETVVVLGASGGIGMAAIDVAHHAGAQVVAVASSDERLERCSDQGANVLINSTTTDDLKSAIRDATNGGADVIVDPVGGSATDASLRALGTFGRLVVIGFASGDIPALPANQVLLRNRTVVGVDWGAWAMSNPTDNHALVTGIIADAASGMLSPQQPTEYPLAEVGTALAHLQQRVLAGKAVLVP